MQLDIPDCRRCAFCIPLRHGILIFGYLNVVFTLTVLSIEIWVSSDVPPTTHIMTYYRGVGISAQLWWPFLLYALEIFFNIILLVGAHTKRTCLIRVYYYYGIMTTVATTLTFMVVHYNQYKGYYFFDLLEICLLFSGFVLQVYLLLLIRTELEKLKFQQSQLGYVNHMSEILEPPISNDRRNPFV